MKTYRIAILPGDGIGPEVMAEAVRVLEAAAAAYGLSLMLEEGLIGAAALDATGRFLPPETLKICRAADAVLLGPVGGSRWEHPTGSHHPKQAVMTLRSWLGTYATVRPIRLYPCVAEQSPMRRVEQGLNLVVVHDHASGLPYGTPRGIEDKEGKRVATNTQIYTSLEVERVARLAFRLAAERSGRVVSVDQSKLLETGQLWRDTVEALAAEEAAVAVKREDADNFLFNLITRAADYDVVLADHTLGELISISAAALTGSYAVHPAAYVGDGGAGVFQPSHGAAPDIAGAGVADPVAAIRAAGLMLHYAIGHREAARAVEAAVEETLAAHIMTPELSGAGEGRKTAEVGSAIARALTRSVGRAGV